MTVIIQHLLFIYFFWFFMKRKSISIPKSKINMLISSWSIQKFTKTVVLVKPINNIFQLQRLPKTLFDFLLYQILFQIEKQKVVSKSVANIVFLFLFFLSLALFFFLSSFFFFLVGVGGVVVVGDGGGLFDVCLVKKFSCWRKILILSARSSFNLGEILWRSTCCDICDWCCLSITVWRFKIRSG